MRCLASLPAPFGAVPGGATTRAFFHGDCLDLLARLEPDSVDVVVTSPPYNLGIRYRIVRRHAAPPGLPELDAALDGGGRARAGARTALSSLTSARSQPIPWAGLDVAQVARAHLHAAEHHPLDQVDRHRSRRRRRRRARPRPGRRPLQADQQPPLRQRLPRVHLPLHAARRDGRSTGRRSACPTRTSRT